LIGLFAGADRKSWAVLRRRDFPDPPRDLTYTRSGAEPVEGAVADGGHPRSAVGAENLVVELPRTDVGRR
jgi:hypothetical protein